MEILVVPANIEPRVCDECTVHGVCNTDCIFGSPCYEYCVHRGCEFSIFG